ncbi:hypothetical protein V9T40_005110 [Parthenolecanium corni]|uniref:Coiled-coil domain-containing protein 93 n=1 Tax=Parthenolecanium corni TaxID=536013 RepID=A0AAN9Y2R9_9HEMI
MISQKEIFLSRGYDVPNFVFDADGKKIEIETREDEEQSIRLDAIIKLLVGAGYYRAKIKGISPFDIVVGGMTWCLDSGDIDLDVDLLFEEGLSIGQKIALTEKIVVVLPKIKCPHSIEPHEIQGLNFIHIYPVIEWLINWSKVNREKQAAYLREYARNQYHKNFTDQKTEDLRQQKLKCLSNVERLMETYQPKRIAIQTDRSIEDIKLKLASTLAEYGITPSEQSGKSAFISEPDLQLNQAQQASVLRGLSSQDFSEDARKKLKLLNKELNELKEREEKLNPALQEELQKHEELESRLNEINVDINSLTDEEQKAVLEIQDLIKMHEALREEEKNKKTALKQELIDLQTSISELENSTVDEENEQLEKQTEKLKKILTMRKLDLADVARNVTSKERELERIPTRAELSQYQKRYMELYHIHTMKTAEAKEDIMTYNMLNNRLNYIRKQNKIVNSLQETFSLVMSQGLNQDQFLQQLEGIIEGVVKTKETLSIKKMNVELTKTNLQSKLKKLQEEKTEYAKAITQLNNLYSLRNTLSETDERLNVPIATLRASVESFRKQADAEYLRKRSTETAKQDAIQAASSNSNNSNSDNSIAVATIE